MFEKLALMEQKYNEISEKLSDPEVVSDNKLYAQLMKEFKNLTPIVEKYREYKKAQASTAVVLIRISRKWHRLSMMSHARLWRLSLRSLKCCSFLKTLTTKKMLLSK